MRLRGISRFAPSTLVFGLGPKGTTVGEGTWQVEDFRGRDAVFFGTQLLRVLQLMLHTTNPASSTVLPH